MFNRILKAIGPGIQAGLIVLGMFALGALGHQLLLWAGAWKLALFGW